MLLIIQKKEITNLILEYQNQKELKANIEIEKVEWITGNDINKYIINKFIAALIYSKTKRR